MVLLSNKTLGALALLSTILIASNAQADECGVLSAGQELLGGEKITSCDGHYRLEMQTDGNLVEYDNYNGKPLWYTKTFNEWGFCWDDWTQTSQCRDTYSFWFSKRNLLAMQDDGNLVLYTQYIEYDQADNIVTGWRYAIWHTHTYVNRNARLALQNDSNLVIYTPENRVLWHR